MPGRLLLAGGLCWLLLRPAPLPGNRYDLAAVVVNLTGRGRSALSTALGDTQWALVPCELDVETLAAAVILEQVAAGAVPRELLALIPLMNRGGEDGIIARWLEVAGGDADASRRADYSLAVVFAEAVGGRDKWATALKGFNMIESLLVQEWKAAARLEGEMRAKVDAVVRVVRGRYKGEGEQVTVAIRACRDADTLDRWLDIAATADTLAEFRTQTGL